MRGVTIPSADEEITVDQVELYFDLAFVFAFSQVVAYLHDLHSYEGIARAALIFTLLWMPWSQFTWSANAISSSSRPVRFFFLIATLATIPVAATVRSAFGSGGGMFALGIAVIFLMPNLAYLASMEADQRSQALRYGTPAMLSMLIVVIGGFIDGNARIVVWLIALGIFGYSTWRAGDVEWVVRSGHFAERHGLIVIVALGEVIVAIGIPVVNQFLEGGGEVESDTLWALVLSGVFAGLLFWSYFDRVGPAIEHKAESLTGKERGRLARDGYTYFHLFIAGGVILAAAALEEITLHPNDSLDTVWRVMLLIGIASFLLGIAGAVYRAFGVVAKERLIALAVVAVALPLLADVRGLVVLAVLDLVLLGMLFAEHVRIEGPSATAMNGTPESA